MPSGKYGTADSSASAGLDDVVGRDLMREVDQMDSFMDQPRRWSTVESTLEAAVTLGAEARAPKSGGRGNVEPMGIGREIPSRARR